MQVALTVSTTNSYCSCLPVSCARGSCSRPAMERAAVDGGRSKVLRDRLAAWDSQLAPLSDRQREGFMELSSVAASRPLPSQVMCHVFNLAQRC